MTEILTTASYLRSAELFDGRSESALLCICALEEVGEEFRSPDISSDVLARVWELLETPQTVTTICRILASERAVDAEACKAGVQSMLTQLYRDDLIQISPDT